MPIRVFDYRHDLHNLVVRPEGRARFRRVELGPWPPVHSHDLGAETFLVLDGQIEFKVEDETVICTPGQVLVVPPRTRHAVRAVGAAPGAIFLSVAPHVEPTHTMYDEAGACLPPRYGVWREAGDGDAPEPFASRAVAADAYRAATARLLELLQADTLVVQRADAATDELWAALYPVLEQVRTVERTWNALAIQPRS